MSENSRALVSRPWRDPRWLAAGALFVFVFTALLGLFGPDPALEVSPTTTVITAPLAADGLPDYSAAILAMAGPAPPPEENAAVDLLEVLWPLGLDRADLTAACSALGIPDMAPVARLEIPPWESASGVALRHLGDASERPWTAAEWPEVAAWLEANGAFLDRLVSAADKPRLWCAGPMMQAHDHELPWFATTPSGELGNLNDLLGSRALLAIGEGRPDAAWKDLRALRRWARLLSAAESGPRGPGDWYTSQRLDEYAALSTARYLVADPATPAAILDEIRNAFADSRPIDPETRVHGDHLVALAFVVHLARRTPGGRPGRLRATRMSDAAITEVVEPALITRLDWNAILVDVNRAHDDVVAALRLPTFAARRAAIERLQASWGARLAPTGRSRFENLLLSAVEPRHRRELVAAWVAHESFQRGFHVDGCREQASVSLVQASLALAAWRADRRPGEPPYPERLDDLVPAYAPAVPFDPLADVPLRYRRDGDGCLLWSVGPNGRDEGGDDGLDRVVRMPAPAAPGTGQTRR